MRGSKVRTRTIMQFLYVYVQGDRTNKGERSTLYALGRTLCQIAYGNWQTLNLSLFLVREFRFRMKLIF